MDPSGPIEQRTQKVEITPTASSALHDRSYFPLPATLAFPVPLQPLAGEDLPKDRYEKRVPDARFLFWKPGDWQFSVSSRYLFTNNMAGFYNGGISVNNLASNGDGIWTMDAGGFSSAYGTGNFALEANHVRKRQVFEMAQDEEGRLLVQPVIGSFESRGPSLGFALSQQRNNFVDEGWEFTFNDRQLESLLFQAGYDMAGEFEDMPTLEGADTPQEAKEYFEALEEWVNSADAGFSSIPWILSNMFRNYHPEDDYYTEYVRSEAYPIQTTNLDTQLCLESSVWDYQKSFNFFHSGKACLEGSAVYFGGRPFDSNFYLGAGPYFEHTLLSYHGGLFRKNYLPPALSLSTFAYAKMQYFNGFDLEDGFDDNNRFVTANIGLGVRATLPSLNKNVYKEHARRAGRSAERAGRFVEQGVEGAEQFAQRYSENFPQTDIEDLTF